MAKALAELNSDENREKTRPSYVNNCIEFVMKNDQKYDKLVCLIKSGEKVNQIFQLEGGVNILTPLRLALNRNLGNEYIDLLARAWGKVYVITDEQQKRINTIMQPHMARMRVLRDVFTRTDSYLKQCGLPQELEIFIRSTTLGLLEFDVKVLLELNACKSIAQVKAEKEAQKPFVEKVQDNCSIQ